MKLAIETFVSIIIIVMMALLGTGYITASLDTQNAQRYHASVITEVEAGHFSERVIQSCIDQAKVNGYQMEDGSSGLRIETAGKSEEKKIAEVTLTYQYSIPLLNLFLKHEIVGYAR